MGHPFTPPGLPTYLQAEPPSHSQPLPTYLPAHLLSIFGSLQLSAPAAARCARDSFAVGARKAPASNQMLGRPWARAALRLRSAHGSATSRSSWAPAQRHDPSQASGFVDLCSHHSCEHVHTRSGRWPTTYLPAGRLSTPRHGLPTYLHRGCPITTYYKLTD